MNFDCTTKGLEQAELTRQYISGAAPTAFQDVKELRVTGRNPAFYRPKTDEEQTPRHDALASMAAAFQSLQVRTSRLSPVVRQTKSSALATQALQGRLMEREVHASGSLLPELSVPQAAQNSRHAGQCVLVNMQVLQLACDELLFMPAFHSVRHLIVEQPKFLATVESSPSSWQLSRAFMNYLSWRP